MIGFVDWFQLMLKLNYLEMFSIKQNSYTSFITCMKHMREEFILQMKKGHFSTFIIFQRNFWLILIGKVRFLIHHDVLFYVLINGEQCLTHISKNYLNNLLCDICFPDTLKHLAFQMEFERQKDCKDLIIWKWVMITLKKNIIYNKNTLKWMAMILML